MPDMTGHFLVCTDPDEITVITTEERLKSLTIEEIQKWFTLFEVKVSKPFQAPGFLAAISKTIADAGCNILIVSTYSKDYVLLRTEDTAGGVTALQQIGFCVETRGISTQPQK